MNPLYTISEKQTGAAGEIQLAITLNPEHEIFKAHFPGDPILPGVYMIRIVKETVNEFAAAKLFLKKARNIKFLAKVNPILYPVIHMQISMLKNENGEFQVNAHTWSGELVFFKFSGTFAGELVRK